MIKPQTQTEPSGRQLSRCAIALIVGAIAILAITSCGIFVSHDYSGVQELEQNLVKWKSLNITHYRMSVKEDGSTKSLYVIVEVKDDKVISVVDAESQRPLPEVGKSISPYEQDSLTIPGVFYGLQRIYSMEPPIMRITYNSKFSYPESTYIDPYTEPCCEDYDIDIQDFQVLP